MKSRSFAAPGRWQKLPPRSSVMKQVCENARIAVGNLYYLGFLNACHQPRVGQISPVHRVGLARRPP